MFFLKHKCVKVVIGTLRIAKFHTLSIHIFNFPMPVISSFLSNPPLFDDSNDGGGSSSNNDDDEAKRRETVMKILIM
jgi:hypothetical protein